MKKIYGAGALVAVAFVASIAASPYLALQGMKAAVQNKDADALSDYVDFPALRENVKGQLLAHMSGEMDSPEMKANPFANMGMALGIAMVGTMVDKLVSPAGVIALLRGNDARAAGKTIDEYDHTTETAPDYVLNYKGWSRVTVHLRGENQAGVMTMKRDGLWGWKMTAFDLPDRLGRR